MKAAQRAFFVAGTDTDAGKTTVASALLAAARQQGLSTLACKPLASGAQQTADGLRNADALSLAAECSIQVPYSTLNPYVFEPSIAPHLAASDAGMELHADTLAAKVSRVLEQHANFCLIEGAGGWRVPINQQETLADLAKLLELPVILVVGIRLGCINHALLTVEAIQHDGLPLAGWIANQTDPDMARFEDNLHCLQDRIAAPHLATLPWQTETSAQHIAGLLSPALEQLLTTSHKKA